MTSISRDRHVVGPLVPSKKHGRASGQEIIPRFVTSIPLPSYIRSVMER